LTSLVRRRIPESFESGTTIDMLGVALVTGAAFGVVWGLMRGNGAGWTSLYDGAGSLSHPAVIFLQL
jgi:hypothetical protein